MIIDFHSHFFPANFLAALSDKNATTQFEPHHDGGGFLHSANFRVEIAASHYDLNARLAAMNAAGVDVQCLTPTIPGVHAEDAALGVYLAQQYNDGVAEAVAAFPDRFAGIALLPLQDPAASVIELERAVTQLGLKGGALFTNINGQPLDDPAYLPLYQKSAELDAFLWLHPTTPTELGLMADYRLVITAGFMFETTIAVGRLIFSGILEQLPELKLVVSQMGGTLPFLAERIERGYQTFEDSRANISLSPTAQLKLLYYDTTPGTPAAITFTAQLVGVDRLMMGSDYPQRFGDMVEAIETIRQLKLSDAAKSKIMGGTARGLLKLG